MHILLGKFITPLYIKESDDIIDDKRIFEILADIKAHMVAQNRTKHTDLSLQKTEQTKL